MPEDSNPSKGKYRCPLCRGYVWASEKHLFEDKRFKCGHCKRWWRYLDLEWVKERDGQRS